MTLQHIQVERTSQRAIPGIIKFVKSDAEKGTIVSHKDGFHFFDGKYTKFDLGFFSTVVISETEPINNGEAYLIEGADPEGIHYKDPADGCKKPYCNKILVMPEQFPLFFLRLNGGVTHNTRVEVEVTQKYIEPDDSIHCNRGDDVTVVKLNVFDRAMLNLVGNPHSTDYFTRQQVQKVLEDWEQYKSQPGASLASNEWFKSYAK
jgi:hypothetical protein